MIRNGTVLTGCGRNGESMEELDKAISILARLIFRTVGREEIDSTVKEVIALLESVKKKM